MHSNLSNIPPTSELFAKHKIVGVHINFYPQRTLGHKCHGRIELHSGEFESEKIFNGSDFDDVIGKMRIFLESLDASKGEIES